MCNEMYFTPIFLWFTDLLCIDKWIQTYVCEYSHATMYMHACACMRCVGMFTHMYVTYVCVCKCTGLYDAHLHAELNLRKSKIHICLCRAFIQDDFIYHMGLWHSVIQWQPWYISATGMFISTAWCGLRWLRCIISWGVGVLRQAIGT